MAPKKEKSKVIGKSPKVSTDETNASQTSDSAESSTQKHRGVDLTGLLESSLETSGNSSKPINTKRGSMLATNTCTSVPSSEGSQLTNQREKMKFESNSPYSPSFSYGSISLGCDQSSSFSMASKSPPPTDDSEQQLTEDDQTTDGSKLKL